MLLTKDSFLRLIQRKVLPQNSHEAVRSNVLLWIVTGGLLFGSWFIDPSIGGEWGGVIWLAYTTTLVVVVAAGLVIILISHWARPLTISLLFAALLVATIVWMMLLLLPFLQHL